MQLLGTHSCGNIGGGRVDVAIVFVNIVHPCHTIHITCIQTMYLHAQVRPGSRSWVDLSNHNRRELPQSLLKCTAASSPALLPSSSDFKPPSSPIVPIVQGLLSVPFVFDLAANAARNKVCNEQW